MQHDEMKSPYRTLALAVAIHLLVMFILTYALVNSVSDIFVNINRVYMAGMMVAPMVVLMLTLMGGMYKNKQLNRILYATSLAVFVGLFTFARTQTFVGDTQFLKSMIPHHSSAIVMCEKSDLADQEIKTLCKSIVEAQQREIDQMETILQRLTSSK